MKTFDHLTLATVLAVASAMVAGCDDHNTNNDWQASNGPTRVCVDKDGKRVADDQCAPVRTGGGGFGANPFLWYYLGTLNRGYGVPGYGGFVGGGSYQPAAGVSYGAAPAAGIARGGFGGTAHSTGGAAGAGE